MPNKKIRAAGRFGARYGTKVKKRLIKVEDRQRQKQNCPFCSGRAKRISSGIWLCKKCRKKFAAHAYYLEKDSIDPKLIREAQINRAKFKEVQQSKTKKQEKKTAKKSAKRKPNKKPKINKPKK